MSIAGDRPDLRCRPARRSPRGRPRRPPPRRSGSGFRRPARQGLNNLQATQAKADDLAVQAAHRDPDRRPRLHDRRTEAALATQLTVAVRNKALEAFNEIMRMQA